MQGDQSVLRLRTGLAMAALTALPPTVIVAITSEDAMANTKTPQPISI